MKSCKYVCLSIVMITFLAFAAVCGGEPMIVVNKNVPADALTEKEVRDIYLGNKTRWNNGQKIAIIILSHGDTHVEMTRNVLGIPPEKLSRLWKRAFFSGAGNLPKICKTEDELVKLVEQTPDAIGYIDSATPHPNVKGIPIQK